MKTLVQRLCWNTRGWMLPSGDTVEKGFPQRSGFGHEEWNFALRDAVGGHVYGYTYKSPSLSVLKKHGEKFRIIFFVIDPVTKIRSAVGIYHGATCMDDTDYKSVFKKFSKEGIFKRRIRELKIAAPALSDKEISRQVFDSIRKKWLSVKCPVNDVEILSERRNLENYTGEQFIASYFAGFTYLVSENPSIDKIKDGRTNTKADLDRVSLNFSPLLEDSYPREDPRRLNLEILPRHNRLSNKICTWLISKKIEIGREQARIDLRFIAKGVRYIVELKVCYSVGSTRAIRESIGQLLEYNHYPKRSAFERWIIILDESPSSLDREYIDALRSNFSFPLFIGWPISAGFAFHPPLDI